MMHSRGTQIVLCVMCLLVASMVLAQAPGRFSVNFKDTPLNAVLDALKRFDPGLQFSMTPAFGERKITASER